MSHVSRVQKSLRSKSSRQTHIALSVLVPLLMMCWGSLANGAFAAATGGYPVYLPLVGGQVQGQTTPPTSTPPTPTPPADTSTAVFMQATQGKKIAGAHIKIDAQGGTHMAYYDAVPLDKNPGATYAYCPPPASQCADPSKWSFVSNMGDKVDEVQLQLTAEGQPRLLIGYHAISANTELYIYGECNAACTSGEDAWSFVAAGRRSLSIVNPGGSSQPKRTFALDHNGRPAFVVYDNDYTPEPDHAGGYYYSCQAACTVETNWKGARFTYRDNGYNEVIGQPVLQFTAANQPRILAELFPLDGAGDPGIYYFACDGVCNQDSANAWKRVKIDERISGPQPSWDLELNAQDQPRVSYFKYLSDRDTTQQLYYLWCDTDCSAASSWHRTTVGMPNNEGVGADLALDGAGRPRIASLTSTQLAYTWCDGDCSTAQGWKHSYPDSDDRMAGDYPVPLPATCKAGIWDGYAPTLALDRAGDPQIAYDASFQASCQYQDPSDPSQPPRDEFIEVWHSVRTVFMPHP